MLWLAIKGVGHVFLRRPVIPTNHRTRFVFFKSINRSDYDSFFSQVHGACSHSKTLVNLQFRPGVDFRATRLLLTHLDSLKEFHRATSSFVAATYFYSKLIDCIRCIEQMKTNQFAHLIVFADMQQWDSALVQYFRKRGATTATLQHGLYINTSGQGGFENINRINYENATAQYFLAWGQGTKALLKEFTHTRVEVVGKPLSQSALEAGCRYANGRFIGVVCDSTIFKDFNRKLLAIAYEVAERLGLKVQVRFHPDDRAESYDLRKHMLLQDASIVDAELVLGHVSTFIYELMRLGVRVFKLRSAVPSHRINEWLLIDNSEDVIERIYAPFEFHKEGEYFIKYVGKESIARYAEFFNQLESCDS